MPTYEVSGTFKPGGEEKEFTVDIEADNEDVAREHAYTTLGSRHRLKRTMIEVEGISETEGDET